MVEYSGVKQRLNEVFRNVFDDNDIEIFDLMTVDDVEEWDSLAHITLILEVEREFGMRFKTAEVGELSNVRELIQLVMERATV